VAVAEGAMASQGVTGGQGGQAAPTAGDAGTPRLEAPAARAQRG